MDLIPLRRALRRGGWLLALLPLVAAATAGAVSHFLPKQYEGRVQVLVKPAPLTSTQPGVSLLTSDQISKTYATLMTTTPLLQSVVDDLHLPYSTDDLAQHINVSPTTNTTILQVVVSDTRPERAAEIANRLVSDFIAQTTAVQQTEFDQESAGIQSQIDAVEKQISQDQNQVNTLSGARDLTLAQQNEVADLNQRIFANRTHYNDLIDALASLEAKNAQNTDNLVVVAPALIPTTPAAPRPMLNAALAFVVGLLVAGGLAILLDKLDQTVKDDEEFARRTGLMTIGRIGYAPGGSGRLGELTALAQEDSSEAYRVLRTNLLFSSVDRDIRTVVVTSSTPGEGKSRTAANLAVVLAEAGHRTLLLDGDFRRPAQHRIFGRVRNHGLSNLILGDMPESELITPVDGVSNLWLATSGPIPPNPSELLGSSRMGHLLRSVRQAYRYVIIDTPPVNAVADPLVLAESVDGYLLVAESGRTTYPAFGHAQKALEHVGAKIVGAVINKVRAGTGSYYYSYSYGYRGRDENRAAADVEPAASGAG